MLSLFASPPPDALAEITAAARAYYRQAVPLQLTATDFFDWLAQLPPAARATLSSQGFAIARHQLAFLRHCLEQRGYSLRAHMMQHLSLAAYAQWASQHQFSGELPDGLDFG